MQHGVCQQLCTQRVDQRLQFDAAATNPARQGRARQMQTGTRKDLFLAIQRQVIRVLRDQHLRQ